ncbi:hypothetical protein AX17_001408 [Amanita inopinata Kibby_2008]|nr:hypothetical protein AX17_001408 [Amanita inopinata Kibby_2008]
MWDIESTYDPGLLDEEPFRCWFLALVSETGRRHRDDTRLKPLVDEIKKHRAWTRAVQRWLDLTFPVQAHEKQRKRLVVDHQTLHIFVQFQWELYRDSEQARLYLRKIYKAKKYDFAPDGSVSPKIPQRKRRPGFRDKSVNEDAKWVATSSCAPPKNKPRHIRSVPRDLDRPHSIGSFGLETTPSGEVESRPQTSVSQYNTVAPVLHGVLNETTIEAHSKASVTDLNVTKIRMENNHSKRLEKLRPGHVSINGHFSGADAPLLHSSGQRQWNEVAPSLSNHSTRSTLGHELVDESPENWLCMSSNDLIQDLCHSIEEVKANCDIPKLSPAQPTSRPKLPLPIYPPIWAQSRQEVCESFGWFRSYQGGVYYNRDVVKGYLLGGFSASRDRFEHRGRLIISHGGGKAASLHQHGGHECSQLADDQVAHDKSVRALLRTYRESRPLVLVIDDKYALFPYDLSSKGITYAILGFYTIAYAWAEYQPAENERGRVIRYKFAFRWCDGQGQPWWIQDVCPDMSESSSPMANVQLPREPPAKLAERSFRDIRPPTPIYLYGTCSICREQSPNVYAQGWTCLSPDCPFFWITGNRRALPDKLDYNPKFLELTKPFLLTKTMADSLKPSDPISATRDGIITTYASTRGWHCSQCGRLSCRYKWEKWECAHCHFDIKVVGRVRSSHVLRNLHVPVPFQDHYYPKVSEVIYRGVSVFNHEQGHGYCQTFELPYGRGFIHHIKAGDTTYQPDADKIFLQYQEQALNGSLPFRRWPLRAVCRGSLLTNYFSQNCGVPYQYVGGTENTLPFDQAPSAVLNARKLIESCVSKALNQSSEFNEVLSAAYMERQRMAFHSDSEPGLGPLVAGLSLGSPALMHFRLLAKYEPIREQRHIAISFVLRHGDVLVMNGSQVQEYYEHTVVPSNFRIAATARCIHKDH